MVNGVLSVMMTGATEMLKWLADSWDTSMLNVVPETLVLEVVQSGWTMLVALEMSHLYWTAVMEVSEMRYNGEWGTICDDDWSNRNAKVACRQLGYKYAERSSRDFGAGNGTTWLDNVGCTGNESSLLDCNHGGLGVHNCDHAEDIGIICSSKLIV